MFHVFARRRYALCLLGFGWSEKALVDYTNGNQWISQISDFVEEASALTEAHAPTTPHPASAWAWALGCVSQTLPVTGSLVPQD